MEWIKNFYKILEEYTSLKLEDIREEEDSIFIKDCLNKEEVEWKKYNLYKFVDFKLEECRKHNIYFEKERERVIEIYRKSFDYIKKEAWISEVGKSFYVKEELEKIKKNLDNISRVSREKALKTIVFKEERKSFSIDKLKEYVEKGNVTKIKFKINKMEIYKNSINDEIYKEIEAIKKGENYVEIIFIENNREGIEFIFKRDMVTGYKISYLKSVEDKIYI